MELTAAARITADQILKSKPRETYWAISKLGNRLQRLLKAPNHTFASHVGKDFFRFVLFGVRPVTGETRERAKAAAEWLLRAYDAAADGGVSLGYFPCDAENGWLGSYPETTGYIITSLLEYARQVGVPAVRERALDMARWEARVQMPSGAVQGGISCPPEKQTPCAFNTGMVLDGWCSAYAASPEEDFLRAGRGAADYLLGDMTEEGYFRTNGNFVTPGIIKTYNCLCAWSLYRFGEMVAESTYEIAAVRAVEAALRQQKANGWFANNCLTNPDAPLLHTISYTLQGILETGILAGRQDFVDAVCRGVDPLLGRMPSSGFLHGRYYNDWKAACFSSCLTGSAQLAVVCYRLFEHTGGAHYRAAADKIVNFLKGLQEIRLHDAGINGALAGSFPIFGGYMTAGYPNWATKYLLDSLLLQRRLGEA
jgi:hypothetical protein